MPGSIVALAMAFPGFHPNSSDSLASIRMGEEIQYDGVGSDGITLEVHQIDAHADNLRGSSSFFGGKWPGVQRVREF
jgi:hypothetical protein